MNENEAAEQFNRNLDAALSGARRAASGPDPEAMETAAGFIRVDFSGESAIKDALRARLAADPRVIKASLGMPKLFRLNSYAQASLALACLVLIIAVLIRPGQRRATPPDTARPVAEVHYNGIPVRGVQTADSRAAVTRPAVAPEDRAVYASELLNSVPMARIAGERLESFPIETKAGGSMIKVVQGRKIALKDGTGVVWETEDAIFTLESREISPGDLFQRKTL